MIEQKRNVVVVQTLHDVSFKSAAERHDFQNFQNLCALESHTARHNKPDVAAAQNHDFFADEIAFDVGKSLRHTGGINARGTSACQLDCAGSPFPATHRKDDCFRLHRFKPCFRT